MLASLRFAYAGVLNQRFQRPSSHRLQPSANLRNIICLAFAGERSSAGRASVCGCERHPSRRLFSIGYSPVIRCNLGYLVEFWTSLGTDWVRSHLANQGIPMKNEYRGSIGSDV
jgi:hypothetical protein